MSLSVVPGNHVFTLTAYDQTNGKGNVLSTNSTGSVYVSPTGITTISLVLQGVVDYVKLTLATTDPPAGTKVTIPLAAVLEDADKNIIVGPGAFDNPVTLTTTDATNGPISKTVLKSPADEVGLSITYSGSASVTSITYGATATDLPSANVTPAVLKPIPGTILAATSTGALSALIVDNTVQVFYPTSSISAPSSTGLIEVPALNSGGVITSTATHKNLATKTIPVQKGRTPEDRSLIAGARPGVVRISPDYVNPAIAGTGGITACSADQVHLLVYCIDSVSANITVINGSSVPATVLKTIPTDAANSLTFSGGSCLVCGIVYDPNDNAAIIGTSNGIEVYSAAGAHISTTLANVSETFGYNPVTNQVFNPEYSGTTGLPSPSLDVIDIKTKTRYTLTPSPSTLGAPDQGAVDSHTNIGLSFEEFTPTYYLLPFGSGTFTPGTNSFTLPTSVGTALSTGIQYTCSLAWDGISIDSSIDVAFFNAEFCAGTVGAAQLPSTSSATPVVSSWAFAPLPATPDGSAFNSGYDPHVQMTIHFLSGGAGDYGILGNGEQTYLAITNLTKLLAAPRSASDPTLVDPSYDLISNGVVTYIPI